MPVMWPQFLRLSGVLWGRSACFRAHSRQLGSRLFLASVSHVHCLRSTCLPACGSGCCFIVSLRLCTWLCHCGRAYVQTAILNWTFPGPLGTNQCSRPVLDVSCPKAFYFRFSGDGTETQLQAVRVVVGSVLLRHLPKLCGLLCMTTGSLLTFLI